jgi:UDP-N-acetylglucosamine acyltransferase
VARIHPTAIVDSKAKLDDSVEIGPFCMVGPDVTLARGVRLLSHAIVEGVTEVGEDCVLHPFACLGGAPQHSAHRGEPTRVIIGARNVFREHVTVHAGTAGGRGVTTVGDDGLFMVSTHIGHDCIIGDYVTLAPGARVSGKCNIGEGVYIGSNAVIREGVSICDDVTIGAGSVVLRNITEAGTYVGVPAKRIDR